MAVHRKRTIHGSHKKAPTTRKKAGKILRHGTVRGKKLTPGQRRFFGAIRGGSFGHPRK